MKKMIFALVILVLIVAFISTRLLAEEHDEFSGTYLGEGHDFKIELRINNGDTKVEWFLDLKDTSISEGIIEDVIEIDLNLESGESISLTDEENSTLLLGDRGELNLKVDSLPKEVRIRYNDIEELITIDLIAARQ